jgi:Uncharacterised nucleotidyltransferase
LLLAVAQPHGDDDRCAKLVKSVDLDEMAATASFHQVVSLLHDRLCQIDAVPRSAIDVLARPRLAAQARRHLLQRTLAAAMDALDVPSLVIKGHVLAADWYENPLTRDFNDIDVLVDPADFGRAVDALESAGIEAATTNWHGFLDHEVAEIPMRLRSTVVDLHWHVVATGPVRRHLQLPTAELIERSVSTRVDKLNLRTLSPVDTLLHLCVNSGLGGGRRLRGLLDIDAVVRSGRVDLAELVSRARRAGAGRLCSAMLQRSSALVKTPVSRELLIELAPTRAWLIANRAIERASVGTRRAGAGIAPGGLISAGRESAVATGAAIARAVYQSVATRRGRPKPSDPEGTLDWRRIPDDGNVPAHRHAYLEWVASAASRRPTTRVHHPSVDRERQS